jgi:hypothetical protein
MTAFTIEAGYGLALIVTALGKRRINENAFYV